MIHIDLPTVTGELTGGLPIIAYKLEWNGGGDGNVFETIYEGLPSTFTRTYTTGTKYKFRYVVKNELGYSVEYSPVMITWGAEAPQQMMPPQSETLEQYVRIWWTDEAVLDSGGIPLSAYSILIRTWNGQFVESLPHCDGTNVTLVGTRECFVPLSVLTSQPYLLSQGALVAAKI